MDLRAHRPGGGALPGLESVVMEGFFERLVAHRTGLDFPDREAPAHRYFVDNVMCGIGAAKILACMIPYLRPLRIIEAGSGFPSAVILGRATSNASCGPF
nr:hypothetical protein [uncultured Rhodopila sp.]